MEICTYYCLKRSLDLCLKLSYKPVPLLVPRVSSVSHTTQTKSVMCSQQSPEDVLEVNQDHPCFKNSTAPQVFDESFDRFPLLPRELQIIVFQFAFESWLIEAYIYWHIRGPEFNKVTPDHDFQQFQYRGEIVGKDFARRITQTPLSLYFRNYNHAPHLYI